MIFLKRNNLFCPSACTHLKPFNFCHIMKKKEYAYVEFEPENGESGSYSPSILHAQEIPPNTLQECYDMCIEFFALKIMEHRHMHKPHIHRVHSADIQLANHRVPKKFRQLVKCPSLKGCQSLM